MTTSLRFSFLPLSSLIFTSERSIVGGGFDFNPVVFGQVPGKDVGSFLLSNLSLIYVYT